MFDLIQSNNWSTVRSALIGLGTHDEVLDPDCSGGIGDGILDPNVVWFGTSCSNWGRGDGEGVEDMLLYVELFEVG